MYAPLARRDQRAKAELYVRGLLLEGRRKSIQPMAARLADGDEQGLQQFITDSPWDDAPVRRRLARRMTAQIEPAGWVVDDSGLPKDGRMSPGVARQYCGALGKTANCQVIVSVNAVTDRASCPLDWRLFLPEQWDADDERRARAKIPDDVRHRPKWQLALDMLDELLAWGLQRRVVQADGGYGDITAFRVGLEQRELEYVVQVKGTTSAQPAAAAPLAPRYQGRGRPPTARYPDPPSSLRELVLAAGPDAARPVTWREGDRGALTSHFVCLRVRPANDAQRQDDGVLPERWLLAEWPPGNDEPVKYWLSNLPANTALLGLIQLAKLRWRIEHDYRELKQCLGLDHYEGRSYRGLQHHLTCVTVAHAFLTCCRLARAGPHHARPQTAAA
ncbi:MAG: IS701 family transposase [Actinobacteria bacterium]|nr:IS701 family transposase [Actinomycetota bacterium]